MGKNEMIHINDAITIRNKYGKLVTLKSDRYAPMTTYCLELKCKQHPRYKVIRKPRVACEACWAMWFDKQGREYFGW